MGRVYQINKGVAKPIMFKGLKAQYIAYLSVGLVLLLIGFAVLYIAGAGLLVTVPVIAVLGSGLFYSTFALSKRFGQHGLMKFWAKRSLPRCLKFRSRRLFTSLTKRSELMGSFENNRNSRIKYNYHGRS